MRSPLPGMDPYIEFCGLWGDFHRQIIGEIQRALAAALPDRYVVRIGERSYIDAVDPIDDRQMSKSFEPDVKIRSRYSATDSRETETAATLAEQTPGDLIMHGLVETEFRNLSRRI